METAIATRGSNRVEREDRAAGTRSDRLFDLLASWPMVTITGAVLAVFGYVFFATSAPFAIPAVEEACGASPLDMRPYSSADDVASFLEGCGETGRQAYRNLQLADVFYPAVSGLFLASALALTLTHLFPRHPRARRLSAVALLGAGLDYAENFFAWRALAAYPDVTASNGLLGIASAAKTAVFWVAGIILIAGLTVLVGRVLRRIVAAPNRTRSSTSR